MGLKPPARYHIVENQILDDKTAAGKQPWTRKPTSFEMDGTSDFHPFFSWEKDFRNVVSFKSWMFRVRGL